MRDAEDELSRDESAVEISPLPAEKELPAPGTGGHKGPNSASAPPPPLREAIPMLPKKPTQVGHKSAGLAGRVRWRGAWRYILTAVVLCVALAFLLANVVLPRHQPSKQSSSPAAPTATPATSYVPTDYSVNTTIVNGVAYLGAANGAVYALRTSNGGLLWRHKIDPGASAPPVVDSGIVYITTSMSDVGPGSLYALRASDGVQLWRYSTINAVTNLVVANGIAYVTFSDVVSQNGTLVALRANDGTQIWHDTSKGSSYTSPVVDNNVVYVSANEVNGPNTVNATVYALRASNGTQLWHYATNGFSSAPIVDNGIVFIFSDQGLSALQASNGRTLWSDSLEGNIGSQPQVINGVLYFITTKISLGGTPIPTSHASTLPQVGTIGELLQSLVRMSPEKQALPLKEGLSSVYAVRTSDGAVLWHYTLSKENGNNWANWLSIENGTVYVGTFVDQDKSYIYALRSNDGSVLWRQAMHRGMSANAVVSNGVVYIASFINDSSLNQGSGAVYALRASDGSQLWYHQVYWVVYNPPLLVGATIYVGTTGGDVYTFRASSGSLLWHFHTDVQ